MPRIKPRVDSGWRLFLGEMEEAVNCFIVENGGRDCRQSQDSS